MNLIHVDLFDEFLNHQIKVEKRPTTLQLLDIYNHIFSLYYEMKYDETLAECLKLYNNDNKDEELFIIMINTLMELNDKEELINKLEEGLFYYPESVSINNLLINYYISIKEYDLAIENIISTTLLLDQPSDEDYLLGYCYYMKKDYDTSLKYLIQSYESDNNSDAVYFIALIHYKNNDYTKALEMFKVLNNKNFKDYKFYVGLCYANLNNYNKAYKYLKPIYNRYESNKKYNYYLAKASYVNNDINQCLICLSKIYTVKTTNIEIISLLINCYKSQGNIDKALYIAKQHLDNLNGDVKLMELYANILFDSKKYNEALDIYNQISEDINSHDIYVKLGDCYDYLGDLNTSKVYYNKALEVNPSGKTVYISIARNLIKNEQYFEALDILMNKCDSSNHEVIKSIADIYYINGQIELATNYYRECILRHNDVDALKKLSDISLSLGDYKDAINQLTTLLQIDEYNSEYIYKLGKCYLDLNNYEKALEYFESSRSLGQYSDNFVDDLALCYEKCGRFDEALEIYNYLYTTGNKHDLNIKIGLCYIGKNEYRAALSFFELELQNESFRTQVLLYASECSLELRIKDKVRMYIEEIKKDKTLHTDETLSAMYKNLRDRCKDLGIA